MHQIFIKSDQIDGTFVSLSKDVLHHLSHVIRLRIKDVLRLVVDETRVMDVTVSEVTKSGLMIRVDHQFDISNAKSPDITLIQALPKQDKFSDILRTNTELGVRRFIPILSKRVVVKGSSKDFKKKQERWSQVIRSASEQCKRFSLPVLEDVVDLKALYDRFSQDDSVIKLVFWEEEQESSFRQVFESLSLNNRSDLKFVVVIGPEGGFEAQEVESLKAAGFRCASLGDTILRVEHAGVVAISQLLYACDGV